MEGSIRVIVADDHVFVRAGIETLIADEDGFEVAGSCGTYDELLDCVAAADPHVVLTDIRMPPTRTDEGIRAAVALRATHPTSAWWCCRITSRPASPSSSSRPAAPGGATCSRTTWPIPPPCSAPSGPWPRAVPTSTPPWSTPCSRPRPPPNGPRSAASPVARARSWPNWPPARPTPPSPPPSGWERAVEIISSIFLKLDLTGDVDAHRRVKAVLLFLSER
ncbi:MAG: response regulator transcription factor [Acidimicrobiales bacterium]